MLAPSTRHASESLCPSTISHELSIEQAKEAALEISAA
jgi:hypothetical protein